VINQLLIAQGHNHSEREESVLPLTTPCCPEQTDRLPTESSGSQSGCRARHAGLQAGREGFRGGTRTAHAQPVGGIGGVAGIDERFTSA
jgi:hypothetical protein